MPSQPPTATATPMTSTSTSPVTTNAPQLAGLQDPTAPAAPPWRRRLSARTGFAIQVTMIASFLAASAAPTPLYAVYRANWGFSPITVTVVFAVYAVAVLAALLVVGSISDHIGRRPVLLAATLTLAAAMIVFATAGGVGQLAAARIVQGLATGAASGAIGAGLLDVDRVRGTVANGVGPFAGMALGALGSSLLVTYAPAPTHLVYLILLAVLLIQAAAVGWMTETSPRIAGAAAALRPRIGLPPAARRVLPVAALCIVASWALGGFYLSLGPSLAATVVGSHWIVLGGLTVLAITATAATAVLLARNTATRTVMFCGTGGLIVGVGVTLVAISIPSAPLFFVGAVLAGVGLGAGFQGGLRTLLPLAAPHERAGLLSTVYVLCYTALGLPAIIAGILVTHGGLLSAAREYGLAIIALAVLALAGLLLTGERRRPAVPISDPH